MDKKEIKMNKYEALSIVEEILDMLMFPNNHFQENMRQYICEKLDITDESLRATLGIISKEAEALAEDADMVEYSDIVPNDLKSIIKWLNEWALIGYMFQNTGETRYYRRVSACDVRHNL